MALQLERTDQETRVLLNLLVETIEADRYPSRRASGRCATSWRKLARWHRNHRRQLDAVIIRDGTSALKRLQHQSASMGMMSS